jgi:ribosome biogenesis SPOUT family RNA methylase Rps3
MIEYKHISGFLGKEKLWVTNARDLEGADTLKNYAKVTTENFNSLSLKNVCVLDPDAKDILTPEEAKNVDYFLFGGILGGYPPKKRTKEELTKFLPTDYLVRNIGTYQMPTDSAVFTVKEIAKGRKFEEIEFKDSPEFNISQYEVIQVPMRYALVEGKPLVSPELLDLWKNSDDDLFGNFNQDEQQKSDSDDE